jgi:predicted metalloprotease with PDZ domain
LDSVEELDYSEALKWYGLRFKPAEETSKSGGDEPQKGWLGAKTRVDDGRLIVQETPRETPAYKAGLNVGDEILAIGDYRVPPDGLDARLQKYQPGQKVSFLVARRDRLTRLDVTLGGEPAESWTLEIDPDAGKTQKQRLRAWLEGR